MRNKEHKNSHNKTDDNMKIFLKFLDRNILEIVLSLATILISYYVANIELLIFLLIVLSIISIVRNLSNFLRLLQGESKTILWKAENRKETEKYSGVSGYLLTVLDKKSYRIILGSIILCLILTVLYKPIMRPPLVVKLSDNIDGVIEKNITVRFDGDYFLIIHNENNLKISASNISREILDSEENRPLKNKPVESYLEIQIFDMKNNLLNKKSFITKESGYNRIHIGKIQFQRGIYKIKVYINTEHKSLFNNDAKLVSHVKNGKDSFAAPFMTFYTFIFFLTKYIFLPLILIVFVFMNLFFITKYKRMSND